MSETMTIHEDEIAAVAAKLDTGEALDDFDRVILRAVFLLAGKTAADLDEEFAEVAGFAQRPTDSFSLNFAKSLGDGSVSQAFAAGKRQHGTIRIVKEWDANTPML